MLTIERTADEILTLVSDDANAENIALSVAVEAAAPHWLKSWNETLVDDEGMLRYAVHRDEWWSLIEVLETLEPGVWDEQVEEALTRVELAVTP